MTNDLKSLRNRAVLWDLLNRNEPEYARWLIERARPALIMELERTRGSW